MNNKRNIPPVTGIGASMLLVVFVALCLSTFAALSVATAKSNELRSLQNARQTSARYEAENAAQEVLAALPEILALHRAGTYPVSYTNTDLSVNIKETTQGKQEISWDIPMNADRILCIRAEVTAYQPDTLYLTCYKTVSIADWEATSSYRGLVPEKQ